MWFFMMDGGWGFGRKDVELVQYIVFEDLYERFFFFNDGIRELSKVFCIEL